MKYLITRGKYKEEYIGSAINAKTLFRINKNYTKKMGHGSSNFRHFNEKCLRSTSPCGYLKVQIIEQVCSEDPSKTDIVLWYKKDTG